MEYSIISFIWKSAHYFIIWYTDDDDGVVVDDEKVAIFRNLNECRSFAILSEIEIQEEDINSYDFDRLSKWVSSPQADLIEPELFLNTWNLFEDIVSSLHDAESNDVILGEEQYIYEKLFWANNLPSVTPANSTYTPIWASDEVQTFVRLLSGGLRMIDNITSSID